MLVCVFLCAYCTRDRGCSAHPAFPAPSLLSRGTKFTQSSGASRRENAGAHLKSERRHPEVRALASLEGWHPAVHPSRLAQEGLAPQNDGGTCGPQPTHSSPPPPPAAPPALPR